MLGIDPSCSLILYIYGSFYCTWIVNSRLDFHGELLLGIWGERVRAYFCDCHSWSSVVVIIHQMQQDICWVFCARFCAECFPFCRFSHHLFVTESGGHNIIFYCKEAELRPDWGQRLSPNCFNHSVWVITSCFQISRPGLWGDKVYGVTTSAGEVSYKNPHIATHYGETMLHGFDFIT